MTREDAIAAIRESAARGSSTPTFGPSPESYVSEKLADLVLATIEPREATVVGETYAQGVLAELRSETVLAIARVADKWLLYRPQRREFSLAYGSSADSLTIWGFSSSDALAEWLG